MGGWWCFATRKEACNEIKWGGHVEAMPRFVSKLSLWVGGWWCFLNRIEACPEIRWSGHVEAKIKFISELRRVGGGASRPETGLY